MALSEREERVVTQVRSMAVELEELLGNLVGISSHTPDHEGVNRVGREVEKELMRCGMRVGAFVTGVGGQHMIARSGHFEGNKLMLLGHLDTVFPDDPEAPGFRVDPDDERRCLGPGVTDMKGGLVVMIGALRALAAEGLLRDRCISVVLSADEETGSPTARDLIRQEAEDHHLCLGFESGSSRDDGSSAFVTRRRGMLRSRLVIRGREAHSGVAREDGVSAALEAAHRIIALEALNDPERGRSLNVGLVRAGTAVNTVPGLAELEIDARFDDPDDGDDFHAAIAEVFRAPGRPQARDGGAAELEWIEGVRHEPMPRTQAVERMAKRLVDWGADLDLQLVEESRGGCSDANIAAAAGCPAVDGLGTVGGKIHSADEWVDRRSLVERSALLAVTILRFHEL